MHTLSAEETAFVARVRALQPLVIAHRDESEAERRLSPPVVDAMAEAGIFAMYVPRELGGLEVHPLALFEAIEALACADGSAGWNGMILGVGGVYVSRLTPEPARTVLADDWRGIAGAFTPQGQAEAVDGGYRLRGRWTFASGCHAAAWMMAPAVLVRDGAALKDEAGNPRIVTALLPKSACCVLDTWHTGGLRGTGSNDFTVDDAFVPAEFTFAPTDPGRYSGALYRLPIMAAFGPGISATCLGLARASIDALVALATDKKPRLSRLPLRERLEAQLAVAEAEALYLSARLFVREAIADVFASAVAEVPPSLELRTRQRLAAWHTARSCVRAVQLMYETAGTSALYESSPIERAFRDVHAAARHVAVATAAQEAAGRALFGLDPGPLI